MPDAEFIVEPIPTADMLARVYAFDEHSYDAAVGRASANIPFTLFLQWWIAVPTGFLCAFRGGKPFAVVGLFPVSDVWASGFLANRTSERELGADDIKASDRRTWYFSGLSTSARPGRLGVHLPCILGHAILKWWQINAPVVGGHAITVMAEGATSTGAKLLRNLLAPDPLPRDDDDRRPPRFTATIDRAGVRRLLTESPFFSRCRGLRSDAVKVLGHD